MKARVILVVMIIAAAAIAGQKWLWNAQNNSAGAAEDRIYEVAPEINIPVIAMDKIFSGR